MTCVLPLSRSHSRPPFGLSEHEASTADLCGSGHRTRGPNRGAKCMTPGGRSSPQKTSSGKVMEEKNLTQIEIYKNI